MICGLLGAKLGHSYSPKIHQLLGNKSYTLFEKTPEELESFLLHGNFTGLNVTIPYKQTVIPFCSELSPIARKLGAVNTIVRREDGTLIGHNTDYFGFETMLRRSNLNVSEKKVLVLGTGGASRTVTTVLQEHGAQVVTVSRTGEDNYRNLHRHSDAAVIVNTTPVGMYPDTETAPLSLTIFPRLEGVLDVIYNPACTKLLQDAKERGLVAVNGLLMLVAQAKESAEWFMQQEIPDNKIDEIYRQLRMQMENIVLIGMPGCGKSTVGALLAEKSGKQFVDADALIAKKAGCSIPEFFATRGELEFRDLESAVLTELGKQSGLIIATGGGCVTRPENKAFLKRNGRIFCLHRSLELLSTDGRPLSQSTPLDVLYRQRKSLYESFADYHIDNNRPPQDTASEILHIWEEIL